MEVAEQLIARQLRELRKQKRLTLQQVAERAGISKSFLSKVEHCHVSISIAALSRLADALSVSMVDFFPSASHASEVIYVPHKRHGTNNESKLSYHHQRLLPHRNSHGIDPVVITIDGRHSAFELLDDPGEQLIHMLEGEIDYVCGGQHLTLHSGDSVFLGEHVLHGPRPKRKQRGKYLVILINSRSSTNRAVQKTAQARLARIKHRHNQ